ncbi:MAG: hypothetical protein Tp170SUR191951_40 [Prokaryotic dsDNA virus sp.]|nr:hypothetical protein [Pseudomonas sp.]MBS67339.1 hypothetical protein [Pseudomonas sp.]QDP55202.1 MAG: hypothetical protein Tp170SUR191951_40 [Prokaryotic dsDNA virus sp.]|tara:strand:- start:14817 stop:15341 length:525 start_codon:yes stop_codon:yes gene_type:complete
MTDLPDLPDFLAGHTTPEPAKPDDQSPPSLRDELRDLLIATEMQRPEQISDAILHLLNERGHYLPGCPPAAQILKDAQQFAGQLTLSNLCVRLLRIMNSPIKTPESKGMERWLTDYIEGRNHGPIGKPMFWPSGLEGLAHQLRQWGFQPTPTRPAFVARIPGSEMQPEAQGSVN